MDRRRGTSRKPVAQWSKELQKLEQLRRVLKIDTVVKFVGQRPQHELPYYYNAAELVVMPSHYESFSMTAVEAMACGVPVITTNVAGVSTLMDDQRDALITSANNPLLLAQKIEQLLFQPDVRRALSDTLRENVEPLTWDNTADALIGIYNRLTIFTIELTGKSMTLYIFRHGLAVYPNQGYGSRVLTAELLPEGIPPIQRLGKYLIHAESDYQVCSGVLRCRQTAAIVTEATGREFEVDPRLTEYHQETFDELSLRTKSFCDELEQSGYEHVMICTHGAVIAALKHFLTEGSFDRRHENDYIQTGQLMLIRADKSVDVVDFNQEVMA